MLEQKSVPRFWDCSISNCTNAAAIDTSGCERCMQHFCASHFKPPTHDCTAEPLDDETWTGNQIREVESLRARVCDEALLRIASSCNHDIRCELDKSDYLGRSLMGGMHIHLRILFEDGAKWLARVLRHNFTSFSDDVSNSVIISECATLRWLENLNIPTPKLHCYGLRNDPKNEVNVAYMLIDEMAGTSFLYLNPTTAQKQKICDQLAEIQNILYQHPMDRIGCLTLPANSLDDISIGPIVSDRTGTMYRIGPFQDARQYYISWAEHYLQLIFNRQLYNAYSVNAYLIFNHLKILAEGGKWNPFASELDQGPFFLKHMDDKGDHLLVDEDFNITGIIDWTFARAVPIFEAFGPSLVTAELGDLLDGHAGLTEFDQQLVRSLEERNSPLVRFASGPDIVRRLSFGLGMGMNLSWDEARKVFEGIQKTVSGSDAPLDWDEWKEEHLKLWADDERLCELLRKNVDA